ncbi:diguanylate cyclase [Thioalkalivibrio nitratireducens]|nr:diguanylate cyclase [Thioalkalivibrio nitratireducens]
MSVSTWLEDHSTIDTLMDLPLAVAVVHRAGSVDLVNRRFSAEMDTEALTPEVIAGLAARDAPSNVTLPNTNGDGERVGAFVLPLGDRLMLILENGDRAVEILQERLRELERLSTKDRLTGAWNRMHLERTVESETARAARYRQPLSQILLDVDHFKRINDGFGHSVGDEVLKKLVGRVQNVLRLTDGLYRWGGEEFVVLAPETDAVGAAVLAERLRQVVAAQPFPVVGAVTVSLGVAEYLPEGSSDEWFDRCDRAMYRAKAEGRDRVVVDPLRPAADPAAGSARTRSLVELVWESDYASGHPVIDAEHRRLFELANRVLAEALSSRSEPDRLADAVSTLVREVERHFGHEERILEDCGFPGLQGHSKAHQALLRRAREVEAAVRNGPVSVATLVEFLAQDLVLRHILTADRQFFGLVRAC